MGRPRKQPDPVDKAMDQIRYFSGEDIHYDSHALRTSVNGLARVLEQHRTDRSEIVKLRMDAAKLAGEIATKNGDSTTAESFEQSAEDLGIILEALETPKKAAPRRRATTSKSNTGAAKSP
jgi:hypothetical protein